MRSTLYFNMAFNLPIYKAIIADEQDEIDFNAFVDHPAHGKAFETFLQSGKDGKRKDFIFEKQGEQMIVRGVAIHANQPIYRYDRKTGEEYYIYFTAEEIKKMGERMSERNYFNNVNEMHDANRTINNKDITFMEVFYVDKASGVNVPTALSDQNIQDGSMIISYKIKNEELWNKIKNGTYYGFSIEGWFTLVKQNFKTSKMKSLKAVRGSLSVISEVTKWDIKVDQESIEIGSALTVTEVWEDESRTYKVQDGEYTLEDGRRILVDVDGVVRHIFKAKSKKSNKMSKQTFLQKIKAKLTGKVQLGEAVTTDGATIVWDGDEIVPNETELRMRQGEGDAVEEILAPEGLHTVMNEDGTSTIITVGADGIVTMVEEVAADDNNMDEAELQAAMEEMASEIGSLKSDNASLKKQSADDKKAFEDQIEALKKEFTENIELLAEAVDKADFFKDGSGKSPKTNGGKTSAGWKSLTNPTKK